MNAVCSQCGASLSPGDAFCQKCGARQSAPRGEARPRFCRNCGTPTGPGVAFCPKCGTPVSGPPVVASAPNVSTPQAPAPPTVQPAASPPLPPVALPSDASPPGQPSKSGGLLLKVVLGVLGLFLLVTVVVIGSCVYIAYKAKQRVDKLQEAYKRNDIAGMVHAVKGDNPHPAQKLSQWKLSPPDLVSAPSSKIPLRVSLRLVVAGNDPLKGDYESIFIVDKVNDQMVHIKGSVQFPKPTDLGSIMGLGAGKKVLAQKIKCGRTLLRADLESSAESEGYVCAGNQENKFPGTTELQLSRQSLMDLRTRGETPFTTHQDPIKAMLNSFKNVASGSADATEFLNRVIPMPGQPPPTTPPIHCTLRRVGTDVAFPIMVNDQQVQLPAMHVVCKNAENAENREGFVLDDPDNPLSLAGQSDSEGSSQIIRISWQTETTPASHLEQELQKDGRAKVYGIYFDFASDVLRPESKTVLDEIAEVMRKHPDWSLRVEGHTDNIGGDTYNLDLSQRRAAAVKQALVTGYRLDNAKFTTGGFGASRPVASNDTLEGRALNRRVELVRE